MKIVQEDKNILVVYKEAGLATQTAKLGEKDLFSEVKNYLVQNGEKGDPYLAIINRLDQPVEGLVLFARNKESASNLSAQLNAGKMDKKYLAVVYGEVKESTGQLTNYMIKSRMTNLSEIVTCKNKDAKKAELVYNVNCSCNGSTLVEIKLLTGRHHQIRVQLSSAGYPIYGDMRYGDGPKGHIALFAYSLGFIHPVTQKPMVFECDPDYTIPPWPLFK